MISPLQWIRGFFSALTRRTPQIIGWFFCLFASCVMLFDPGRATLSIPSACFFGSLALASLAFSYARLYADDSRVRDEVTYAGEHLTSAACGFVLATFVNYAAADVVRITQLIQEKLIASPKGNSPVLEDLALASSYFLLFLSLLVFVLSFARAELGMLCLFSIVRARAARHKRSLYPGSSELVGIVKAAIDTDKKKAQGK